MLLSKNYQLCLSAHLCCATVLLNWQLADDSRISATELPRGGSGAPCRGPRYHGDMHARASASHGFALVVLGAPVV